MAKKGIILASFGSIYGEAVEKSIGAIERDVQEAYPDISVKRIFLSEALVEKWYEKYDETVLSLFDALSQLDREGVEEVYIQPLTLVSDACFQQLRKDVSMVLREATYSFTYIYVGKPLLSSLGVKNYIDDYEESLQAIVRHLGSQALNKAILLMANGQNQLEYSTLQLKALYGLAPNVAVFTSNGFPNFKQALSLLDRMGKEEVLVVPLAFIGSSHLMEYLGGNRSDSISALLTQAGYGVSIWNQGLGENPNIRQLIVKHLGQSIRMVERRLHGQVEKKGNKQSLVLPKSTPLDKGPVAALIS